MINTQLANSAIAPSAEATYAELGLNSSQDPEKVKSDKNQFLELMIAQLENQNPLEPQEGGEFLAQLAQFSMVDGIERLNASTDTMQLNFRSSQALEAANLVGRSVSVASDRFYIDGEGVSGAVEVPNATSNVLVQVTNMSGEVVKEFSLGEQSKGLAAFTWDGTDTAGIPLPSGSFQVSAFAKTSDGEEQLGTQIGMNVDSVTLGENGSVELNVNGFGTLGLDQVKQIR